MNKFKKMKFWFEAGEVELYETVCSLLVGQGYSLDTNVNYNQPIRFPEGLGAHGCGRVAGATKEKGFYWNDTLEDYEEINIDWLRTTPPETVELGGKTYLKSELEVALENINPIGGSR